MVHIKRASKVWLRSYLQQSIAKEAVIVLLVSDILHNTATEKGTILLSFLIFVHKFYNKPFTPTALTLLVKREDYGNLLQTAQGTTKLAQVKRSITRVVIILLHGLNVLDID